MRFIDLKTSTKLNLSFGFVLLVFAANTLYYGVRSANVLQVNAASVAADWAEIHMLKARASAARYVTTGDEQALGQLEQEMAAAFREIDRMILLGGEGYEQEVQAIKSDMQEYRSAMSDLETGKKQEIKSKMGLAQRGEELIAAQMQQGGSGGQVKSLYGIRLKVANFVWTEDLTLLSSSVDDMRKIMASLSGAMVAKGSVYLDALELYHRDAAQLLNCKQHMTRVGDGIMEILNEANETLTANAAALASTMRMSIIVGFAVALAISVVLSRAVARYIASMMRKAVHLSEQLAQGNFNVVIPEADLRVRDEIGDLARALNVMIAKVREVVASILTGTDSVTLASRQVSEVSQQLSEGSTEQASSTEEVSSAMEQMAANIDRNASSAQQAESIATSMGQMMGTVGEQSRQVLEAVQNIAGKITLVNDIAFQTNILALNAAVEAARAGEHGRGFAVVAAEVRKLAERSKEAAAEIERLSAQSVSITSSAGDALNVVLPKVSNTTQLVQEIAVSSGEQRLGAEQINSALQQLNTVVQQNAAAAEEMASSAEELSAQAEALRDATLFFKI